MGHAEQVGSNIVERCDVEDGAILSGVFDKLGANWGDLDFVVHAVAYSDKEELKGRYVDTTKENFQRTMDVSCYSFTAVAHMLLDHEEWRQFVDPQFYGAEKVMPTNVMGVAKAALEASVKYLANDLGPMDIRVNAISAGPMRTLAGSAIGGVKSSDIHIEFPHLIEHYARGSCWWSIIPTLRSFSKCYREIQHMNGYNAIGMSFT